MKNNEEIEQQVESEAPKGARDRGAEQGKAPSWIEANHELVRRALAKHTKAHQLAYTQYDVAPDQQGLEMYRIILNDDTISSAYVSYLNDGSLPIISLHLQTKNYV